MTLRVTTHNAMIFSLTTLSIMAKRIAPLILSKIYFTVVQSVIMLNVILLNVAEPSKGARYCFMDAQRSIKFKFESVEVHQPFLNELLYAFIVPLWLMSGFVFWRKDSFTWTTCNSIFHCVLHSIPSQVYAIWDRYMKQYNMRRKFWTLISIFLLFRF